MGGSPRRPQKRTDTRPRQLDPPRRAKNRVALGDQRPVGSSARVPADMDANNNWLWGSCWHPEQADLRADSPVCHGLAGLRSCRWSLGRRWRASRWWAFLWWAQAAVPDGACGLATGVVAVLGWRDLARLASRCW